MTHAEQELVITNRVNKLIRSGKPFTVDQIWRHADDFKPGDHRNWLGRWVKELSDTGAIRHIGWQVTERSGPHARPASLWQGTNSVS